MYGCARKRWVFSDTSHLLIVRVGCLSCSRLLYSMIYRTEVHSDPVQRCRGEMSDADLQYASPHEACLDFVVVVSHPVSPPSVIFFWTVGLIFRLPVCFGIRGFGHDSLCTPYTTTTTCITATHHIHDHLLAIRVQPILSDTTR
jgi:hypothetical protein